MRGQVGDRIDGLAGSGPGSEVGAVAQNPDGLDRVGEVESEVGDREDPGDAGLLPAVAALAVVAARGDPLPRK